MLANLTTTIQSIDVHKNASTILRVIGADANTHTTLTLGSVTNSQNSDQLTVQVSDSQTLILNGDNYWASDIKNNSQIAGGSLSFKGQPNTVYAINYTANKNVNTEYAAINSSGEYTSDGSVNFGAVTISSINGPYNDYSALGKVVFYNNGTMMVSSIKGSNTPTILNNSFEFLGTNNTLDLETDTTITHPSVAGFNNITGNGQTNLNINIDGGANIILSNAWTTNGGTPAYYLGKLTIQTPTMITDPSMCYIGNPDVNGIVLQDRGIFIGSTTLTVKPTNVPNTQSNLTYNIIPQDPDAVLVLDSSAAGQDVTIELADSFKGNQSGGYGSLKLHGETHALDFSTPSNWGGNKSYPLMSFKVEGNAPVKASGDFFANNITLNSSAPLQLHSLILSDGGTLTLSQCLAEGSHITLWAQTFPGAISYTTGVTLDLGTYTLNAGLSTSNATPPSSSEIRLSGPLTIKTRLDSGGQSYGHFVIDGALTNGGQSVPSTLNLTDVSSLNINFTSNLTTVPQNGEMSLPLFMTSNEGAVLLPHQHSTLG